MYKPYRRLKSTAASSDPRAAALLDFIRIFRSLSLESFHFRFVSMSFNVWNDSLHPPGDFMNAAIDEQPSSPGDPERHASPPQPAGPRAKAAAAHIASGSAASRATPRLAHDDHLLERNGDGVVVMKCGSSVRLRLTRSVEALNRRGRGRLTGDSDDTQIPFVEPPRTLSIATIGMQSRGKSTPPEATPAHLIGTFQNLLFRTNFAVRPADEIAAETTKGAALESTVLTVGRLLARSRSYRLDPRSLVLRL